MKVIIGAGISGLTAARHLKGECVILEKSDRIGGLSTQYRSNGHMFDYGGHYFHFQNRLPLLNELRKIIHMSEHRRNSKVFIHRRFVPYPLQYHLSYLSSSIGRAVLRDIESALPGKIKNLEEFLLAHFGKTLSGLFFFPFLTKYYQAQLKNISTGMDKGSIPVPSPAEIARGIRGERFSRLGYNPVFYYPPKGLVSFIDAYAGPVAERIEKKQEVVEIDYVNKRIQTSGDSLEYEHLISTMPLNNLLDILVPKDLSLFPGSRHLQHVSTIVTNVVLKRRRRRFHWIYLPEKKFPFYRMGYYPRIRSTVCYLERNVVPAESVTDDVPLDEVAGTLKELGVIQNSDEILHADTRVIPVAYVIFDHNWSSIVPPTLKKLADHDIHSIGRYGRWTYSSMVEDIVSAIRTARLLGSD